ncbi:MAG: FumA C-terminus/TtdB family hydratase beta subunit [Endomicrobiales bacterium]|nr:FumA C-terminus/TtdB family hydratase beta subunit [Endomicrobiales bacterium]
MTQKILTSEVKKISKLSAGSKVLLSGIIYTARDAAHKKISELLSAKEKLPINFNGSIIYYCGPCPAKPGEVIGSCGPTTSSRMDPFVQAMHSLGVIATIGKGPRTSVAVESIKKNKATYFVATGGVGALISKKVISSSVVAFSELGAEAIYKLEIKDLPLIVAIDSSGANIFDR